MDWRRAHSGLRYRIAGTGAATIELADGRAVMAESSRLVYRRGDVHWSLAGGGRGVVGKWLDRTQRRAAGMEARMSRYEGAGEVGFAPASPGEVWAVELGRDAVGVVCQAESLVAVESGIRAEVALVRRIREAGWRTTLGDDPPVGRGCRVPVRARVGGDGRAGARRGRGGGVVGGSMVRGDRRLPDVGDRERRDVPGAAGVDGGYQGTGTGGAPGAAGRDAGLVRRGFSSVPQSVT